MKVTVTVTGGDSDRRHRDGLVSHLSLPRNGTVTGGRTRRSPARPVPGRAAGGRPCRGGRRRDQGRHELGVVGRRRPGAGRNHRREITHGGICARRPGIRGARESRRLPDGGNIAQPYPDRSCRDRESRPGAPMCSCGWSLLSKPLMICAVEESRPSGPHIYSESDSTGICM